MHISVRAVSICEFHAQISARGKYPHVQTRFVSTLVVGLEALPQQLCFQFCFVRRTAPVPLACAPSLGASCPIVKIIPPIDWCGQIAQAVLLIPTLNDDGLHAQAAAKVPVLVPISLFY